MDISKTKRNFIGSEHFICNSKCRSRCSDLVHVALPGHYFGGYPFIPTYFYLFGLFSYLYVRCMSAVMLRKR